MWVAFALQKLLTFFSAKNFSIFASFDVNFNKSLTNDIVSFEQLGPDICCMLKRSWYIWYSNVHPANYTIDLTDYIKKPAQRSQILLKRGCV